MTTDELLQRWSDGSITSDELRELTAKLAEPVHQSALLDDWLLESRLPNVLPGAAVAGLRESEMNPITTRTDSPRAKPWTNWLSWRPLTAAAAGILLGMFCTSVVFGYVVQRAGAVKKMPLAVFDPGLEDENQTLDDGLPERIGRWGMDAASVVTAEGHVKPLQGQRMMRLEPIPREKNVKNLASRVYQVLDLRFLSMQDISNDAEVQVSASFCATNSDVSSRYLIRALALDEVPEEAMNEFWSKTESAGVVSESQRFDTKPGARGWHTFSLKLRLPPESKTLVFILGAVPPEDSSKEASIHYLDEVQVSLLTPESTLP